MKILYANRGHALGEQPHYEAAFTRSKSLSGIPMETLMFHYVGYAEKYGWQRMWDEVIRICDEFHPDLIYFHHFNHFGKEGPVDCIRQLKMRKNAPLFFGSYGDLFQNSYLHLWRRPIPQGLVDMAVYSDAFFPISMGESAQFLMQKGARNIVFMPHTYSDEHFGIPPFPSSKKEYEIVMCGNVGIGLRHPINGIGRSLPRVPVGILLKNAYGNRFCISGRGWGRFGIDDAQNIPFKAQVNFFLKSKIAIDARAPFDDEYYASDRPFFIAGCGVPLIQFYTPRFDKIFKPNVNAYYAHSLFDIASVCKNVLNMNSIEREINAQETVKLIRNRHMADNRVDTILSVAQALLDVRSGRITNAAAIHRLRLWHFLSDIDVESELKHAVVNWVG